MVICLKILLVILIYKVVQRHEEIMPLYLAWSIYPISLHSHPTSQCIKVYCIITTPTAQSRCIFWSSLYTKCFTSSHSASLFCTWLRYICSTPYIRTSPAYKRDMSSRITRCYSMCSSLTEPSKKSLPHYIWCFWKTGLLVFSNVKHVFQFFSEKIPCNLSCVCRGI